VLVAGTVMKKQHARNSKRLLSVYKTFTVADKTNVLQIRSCLRGISRPLPAVPTPRRKHTAQWMQ